MKNTLNFLQFYILLSSSLILQIKGSWHKQGIQTLKKVINAAATATFLSAGSHSLCQKTTPEELTIDELYANNAERFAQLSQCPEYNLKVKKLEKPLQVPRGQFAEHILPMFEALRKQDKKFKNVPLLVSDELGVGRTHSCSTCKHHVVIVDPEDFSYMSPECERFVLAHELGHIDHGYVVERKEKKESGQFDWQFCHKHEYLADEYAVRALGTIEGGLEFFNATLTDDGNFTFDGWTAKFLNYFSEGISHPSHEKRLEKLIALKKSGALEHTKHAEFFKQAFNKNSEAINYINT